MSAAWSPQRCVLVLCALAVGTGFAAAVPPRTKATWGYVDVRPGAHMFWWLEPCTECHHQSIYEEPLVIWLQGGPGASSTGFGNFGEIGPYKVGWEPRQHSWVRKANVLFLDQPVGTGFSYVEEDTANFTTTNAEITEDFMTFLKEFVWAHPEFHFSPLYLFCESYGGKMGAAFAQAIIKEQATAFLPLNFRGVALGDSWIAPQDFVAAWPPFLEALSLVDRAALATLTALAAATQEATEKGEGRRATELWGTMEEAVGNLTDHVDWYNVLRHNTGEEEAAALASLWQPQLEEGASGSSAARRAAARLLARHHPDDLTRFMNGEVRDMLGVIPRHVRWGGQAGKVFAALAGDFMGDVVPVVDDLLAAGVNVTVYNGQLDLICCTLGVDAWLASLAWPGRPAFDAAKRRPLYAREGDADTGAFVKQHENLVMYTVMAAGHMIPSDQPRMALEMLGRIIEEKTPRPQASVQ